VQQLKRVALVFLGTFIASAIFFAIGFLSNYFDPTPQELVDPKTAEEVIERVQSTSIRKWLETILGLGIGTFVGCFLAARWAKDKHLTIYVALIMTFWAVYTFYVVYPDVLWVPISMLAIIILASILAKKMVTHQ